MPSVADDLVYAANPVTWARDVLGYHPDDWQADLLRSRSRKIILNCSRQSGKSTTCAALGLHESIYRRPSFGLVIAPSQDQSSELMMEILPAISLLASKERNTPTTTTRLSIHSLLNLSSIIHTL